MIRIVIAEDQPMLLGTLGSLLNLEEDMLVVGQGRNGEEAIQLVQQLKPDLCIMDVDMPKMSGLEAAEFLEGSACKIMIITTFAQKGFFQRVIESGVNGYLLKDSPSEVLVASIRDIMTGKRVFETDLMDEAPFAEEEFFNEEKGQDKKLLGVKAYITTFIEKIKLPTA